MIHIIDVPISYLSTFEYEFVSPLEMQVKDLTFDSPEKNMLAAIIQCAHQDMQGHVCNYQGRLGEQYRREILKNQRSARLWFRSPSTEPLSFLWCAKQLNLSWSFVRRLILESLKDYKNTNKKKNSNLRTEVRKRSGSINRVIITRKSL